jgi:single-strand selective monofunctional uracil DNA glycosylase
MAGLMPAMTLTTISRRLREAVNPLTFGPPVTHVYNPLDYAWSVHRNYLSRYGAGPKEFILLGMNPGPWGMAQSGIPFGDTGIVRDWLGLEGAVGRPDPEHPRRPVHGLQCPRGEVSGRRLWGWARDRFGTPERFFQRFFVINYCPLSFMEEGGRNRTPDKLPAAEREPLFAACDEALARMVGVLSPALVMGVGRFAEKRARIALDGWQGEIACAPHPSPASPLANSGWDRLMDQAMKPWLAP